MPCVYLLGSSRFSIGFLGVLLLFGVLACFRFPLVGLVLLATRDFSGALGYAGLVPRCVEALCRAADSLLGSSEGTVLLTWLSGNGRRGSLPLGFLPIHVHWRFRWRHKFLARAGKLIDCVPRGLEWISPGRIGVDRCHAALVGLALETALRSEGWRDGG